MIQVGIIVAPLLVLIAMLRYPAAAFGFVLVLMPTEQLLQTSIPIFGAYQWLGNVVLGCITVVGLVSSMVRGQFQLQDNLHLVQILSVILYLWLCATSLWAPEPLVAFDSLRIGVPYAIVLVIVAPMVIRDLHDVRIAMTTMLVYGTFIGALIFFNPNFELARARLGASLGAAERTNPLEIGSLGAKLMLVGALSGPFIIGWWSLPLRVISCALGAGLGILSGTRGQTIFGILFSIMFFPLSRQIANFRAFLGTAVGLGVVSVGLIVSASMFVSFDNQARWSEESMLYGGAGRLENAVDLLSAYANAPTRWVTGLGYQAFWSLPTRSGEIYSHVATADALAEAGLIGFVLYAAIACLGFRSGIRVFRAVRHDPLDRAAAALLLAFLAYSFLIANKQGTVWSAYYIYMFSIVAYRCELALRNAPVLESDEAEIDDESDFVPASGASHALAH